MVEGENPMMRTEAKLDSFLKMKLIMEELYNRLKKMIKIRIHKK